MFAKRGYIHHAPTALLVPIDERSKGGLPQTQLFFHPLTKPHEQKQAPTSDDRAWGVAISPISLEVRMALDYMSHEKTPDNLAKHCGLHVAGDLIHKLSYDKTAPTLWGEYLSSYTTRFANLHDIPIQWSERDGGSERVAKTKAFYMLLVLGVTNCVAVSPSIEVGSRFDILRWELEQRRLIPPTDRSRKTMEFAQIALLEQAFPGRSFNYLN